MREGTVMSGEENAQTWSAVREEALRLVHFAGERGLALRLVGSVGIRLHRPDLERVMSTVRPVPKDLDFVCRKQDRNALQKMLEDLGYENDPNMMVAMEGRRYLLSHSETGLKIDLFVETLDFCHSINLRDRLDIHPVTIPTEELLLHKLQIIELTEGDFIDVGVMLSVFSPDQDAGENALSMDHFLAPLMADWGFWRTVTGNLERVQERAANGGFDLPGGGGGVNEIIATRAQALLHSAKETPKSVRWKMRATLGERLQWWQDVDDREGTY